MSLRTPRFVLGTMRVRARAALRRAFATIRRRPRCAGVVPTPSRPRRGRTLRLTHALVACDTNRRYLDIWPLVRHAWAEIVGLEPVLILVARSDDVPAALAEDPAVRVLEPVATLHTAFQAQCVRLLYPALLDAGGVVVSDVDMVPLDAGYFRRPVAHVGENQFVAYRDVLLELGEIPICYNAARPKTWAAVFDVDSLDDVRVRLQEWGRDVEYAGAPDGPGWTSDQRILHRTLLERGRRARDVWILDDDSTRFRRLERAYVEKWGELSDHARRGILARRYSDFHCLLPHEGRYGELNQLVVELGASSSR